MHSVESELRRGPRPARGLDSEFLPALEPPPLEDVLSAPRQHPREEAVHPFPSSDFWLIRSFWHRTTIADYNSCAFAVSIKVGLAATYSLTVPIRGITMDSESRCNEANGARWCSGSTGDFGSPDPGSNPGRAAIGCNPPARPGLNGVLFLRRFQSLPVLSCVV